MAVAERGSKWGIASLVLMIGELAFGEYNYYIYVHRARPLLDFSVLYQVCVLMQLAAAVCGVVAMRRGSKWWALTIPPALLVALACFFGDS